MQAEILMIGTELLIGQIQDTNATFMAQTLAENGINLYQKTTVGDNQERIVAALEGALLRSDVVLCSGGLGPTEDDITRDCVAEVLGCPLEYHEERFEEVAARFAHARIQITENNKKQAMLPRGASFIDNPCGTAPGILAEDERGTIICMPGVPGELYPMLEKQVIPHLRERYGISGVLHYRVLKVCGVGESRVDSMMGDLITDQSNPTVGLLASADAVRIRIAAHADSVDEANALIDTVDAEVRKRLPGLIMGTDNDTIEHKIDSLLEKRGWRLALVETQTGGHVAQRLVAAGVQSFAGGRVLALLDQGTESRPESAIDLGTDILLEFGADCALVLFAESQHRRTRAVFMSPEGTAEFTVGFYGKGERNQVRTGTIALERVRRLLEGVEEPAL